MSRWIPRRATICVASAFLTLGGCELFGGGGGAARPREVMHSGDRRPLPPDASVVADGVGELTVRAETDGMVYLYDSAREQVLHAHVLKAGERYTVSPRLDLATIDGKPVLERDFDPRDAQRLYFAGAGR